MEVVGRGFLARNLARLVDAHEDVVAFAAGPSSTGTVDAGEFAREASRLYTWVSRCRSDGRLLLYFSTASASMYGGTDGLGLEDGPVMPGTAFGRHKLAMESVIRMSAPRHLVIRLCHAVGPGQRGHQLVPALLDQVRSGQVVLQRDARRDLIAVRDAVGLVDALLYAGVMNDVVNLASGAAVYVEEIVSYFEHRLGVSAEHRYVDATGPHAPVSVDKLRRLLGGSALAPPFPEGYYRQVLDACLTPETGPYGGAEPNRVRGGRPS